MKQTFLALMLLFVAGCSQTDPVNGDVSANFTGTYKYNIASTNGFTVKYTWVVERHSSNMLNLDMTRTIIAGNGSETTARDVVREIPISDPKKLKFSYLATSSQFVEVTAFASKEKLSVTSPYFQNDGTYQQWYEFIRQ